MASIDFINECKNPAYNNRYGKIEFSNPTLEINQSNKLQSFTIDSGCYDDGNIVGSVYVTKFESQLIDALEDTIENRQFDVSVGVKYENNSTEYLNLGSYIVEKPKDEQTENFTSFIGYDLLMQQLDNKYDTTLDYENETITLADVYEELCGYLGLTPVTLNFTNSTLVVEANPFVGGETNRMVLNSIAKVACAFVDINIDANNDVYNIDLKWLSDSIDYTFQTSDYSTLEGGKTVYGPINSLIIKSSAVDSENVTIQDDESIALNGEHQLVISEDYFLYNEEKREAVIQNIWEKVDGLTYTECTLITYTGKPFLEKGNKIRIYLDEENYIDSYVLQHKFTFDGSFTSEIKCPVLTEQQILTKQDVSLGEKLRQTEIIVNKQDGTITSLSSRTESLENSDIAINGKFSDYTPMSTFNTLQTSVNEIQTDTYKKTEIKSILKGEFYDEQNNQIVSEVVHTASATYDENGMTYEKSGANTKTTINEVGVNVKTDNNEPILFAGYVDDNNTQYGNYKGQTLVATDNIMVDNYLIVGSRSRFENYEGGTGCFFIG